MRAIGARLLLGVIVTTCSMDKSRAVDNPVEREMKTPAPATNAHASQPSKPKRASVWAVQHQLISRIRGLSVENKDGQYLGKISDFIVDESSGKVVFGIISYGGLFGFGSKLKAVPAGLFSVATAKVGVVSLDTGRRRWDRAPVFRRADLAAFNKDPGTARALNRYYAIHPENLRAESQHLIRTRNSASFGEEHFREEQSAPSEHWLLSGPAEFCEPHYRGCCCG
jgi:sporulation protein YlmC with PRC-barrel domain